MDKFAGKSARLINILLQLKVCQSHLSPLKLSFLSRRAPFMHILNYILYFA